MKVAYSRNLVLLYSYILKIFLDFAKNLFSFLENFSLYLRKLEDTSLVMVELHSNYFPKAKGNWLD